MVEVEDVDHESIRVEPRTRIGRDTRRRLRRRQHGSLHRPPGRGHACEAGDRYRDAQEGATHAAGRYASIMS
jgi:hypothetical protein